MKQDKGWNRSTKFLFAAALMMLAMAGPSCVFGSETIECSSGKRCPTNKECSADGTACIVPDGCGNGKLDNVEVCDDGNIRNGDECSSDCLTSRNCGNRVMDPNEACDDGNNVSGDGCRSDCLSNEKCPNGQQDIGEACDDGNEFFDDGCTPDCKLESCGNGEMDPGEECDDGNEVSGDGCNELCLSKETCGNGYVDIARPNGLPAEECDDGTGTDDGMGAGSATCNGDCTVPRCGDNKVNAAAEEECDDGPAGSAGCNINCKFPTCGDGIANLLAPNDATSPANDREVCDNGRDEDGQAKDSVSCDLDCTLPFCGDGHVNVLADNTGTPIVLNDTEECDSGTVNTAECNAICTVRRCGDGFVNDFRVDATSPPLEECDERNPDEDADEGIDSVVCDRDCSRPDCDDDVFNPLAEDCESFGFDTATCNVDCTFSVCGDGHLNLAAAELCDTAGASPTCDADCTLARCGDGIVNDDQEQCDSGGVNTVDCNFDCTLPLCGDGILNLLANEECDDSDTSNDLCRGNCRLATNGGDRCGNSRTDPTLVADRFEQCDDGRDGVDNDECTDECTFGPTVIHDDGIQQSQECDVVMHGPFACDADHTFRFCGDGFINRAAGEQCDDGNTRSTDDNCVTCVLTNCGDGNKDPYEQCDDGNRVSGDGCTADCQEECGNGRIDAGEHCDDGNLDDGDECTNDCTFGPAVVLDNVLREGQECVPALDVTAVCDLDHTFAKCGDGFKNVAIGEECDDGNGLPGDGCSADCENECGNGIRDRFEQCDDGNDVNGDACKNDCTFGPAVILDNDVREGDECVPAIDGTNACDPDHTRVACGDGFKNVDVGEDCDDSNLFAGDGCSLDCKRERCGNGRIDGFEQCDGDLGAEDTCRDDCTFGPAVIFADRIRQGAECEAELGDVCDPDNTLVRCGDRFVNIGAGEQCDDGNDAPGDGCSAACRLELDEPPIGG